MNCNTKSPSHTVHLRSYSNGTGESPKDSQFESPSAANTSFLPEHEAMENGPGQSFVQQRIERLYGPGALGMAFRTRRAAIERRNSCNVNGDQEDDSQKNEGSKSAFPSVFRHLRPEFRHQLPLKPKRLADPEYLESSINGSTNGHTVRHIPIQLEDDVETKSNSNSHSVNVEPISNYSPNLNLVSNRIQSLNLSSPKLVKDSVKVVNSDPRIDSRSSNLSQSQSPKPEPKTEVAHDGKYYLQIVNNEVATMEKNIKMLEDDMESHNHEMNEEVKGKLFATIGKAKLFINQKILQFKGLCNKNINVSSSDEFPTTNDDIAGFWDMVSIQVDIIQELFVEAESIRKNGWQEIKPVVTVKKTAKPQTKVSGKSASKTPGPKDESRLKQEEERRKANEVRRKAMREAMMAKKKEGLKNKDVEIFVSTNK